MRCRSSAGGRAGAEVVRANAERAEITATFDLLRSPRELKQWLEEQSIATGAVSFPCAAWSLRDGRSRAYLNGQAVPVQLLRELGNILIDIHGQHEFQSLTRSAAQRELLDDFGRHESLVDQVGIAHRVWHGLLERMLDLETKARDRDARLDLLRYQVRELEALQLAEGEVRAAQRRTRATRQSRPARRSGADRARAAL